MGYIILRETQHTPKVAYPRHPLSPPNDSGIPKHKLLVGVGYAPGVCWKVLRHIWKPWKGDCFPKQFLVGGFEPPTHE